MKILKNYLLNSSYQLLIIIIPIVTIPYISRVLGPEGIGLNTFTAAVIQYFIIAGNLGISTYGNREIAYYQRDKKKRSQIFWEIIFLRFITFGISILCFVVFIGFQEQNQSLYIIQGIAILAALFDISWYFMGMENFKRTVTRNFIVSIVSLVCVFLFVKTKNDLLIYVIITTGGLLIGNLSLWPYLVSEVIKLRVKKLEIKKHLIPALLLFLPQIATMTYLVINKSMIGILDSVKSAGFFGQADTIIRTTLVLVTSFGVVMLPRVSNMYAEGKSKEIISLLSKSFEYMSAIAIPIMFGIMGISLKFAPFFFGISFSEVGILMMLEAPIILFIAWSNVIGTQYLLPLNKLKQYTWSVSIGAIFNILLNFLVIPLFGVVGAMVTTLFTELIVCSCMYFFVRKEVKFFSFFMNTWKYWVSGLLMFFVVFILNEMMKMSLVTLAFQVVIGGLVYILINFVLRTSLTKEVGNTLKLR